MKQMTMKSEAVEEGERRERERCRAPAWLAAECSNTQTQLALCSEVIEPQTYPRASPIPPPALEEIWKHTRQGWASMLEIYHTWTQDNRERACREEEAVQESSQH